MPRNSEVIRQWTILRELEASRRGTIDGLARRTRVSTRTIRRDLEALQLAGFPIYDEVIDAKRYWTLDTKPLRTLGETGFTLAELSALYFSRTLLECLAGTPFQQDLRTAFGKLEASLSPGVRRFLDRLPNVLQARPDPVRKRESARQPEIIARLLEATLHQRRAAMRYHSFSSSRTKDYVIDAYRLVYAQGGLYLVAFVAAYGETRTFAVERIRELSLREETFERPADLADDEMFGNSLGINQGPPERVRIEFAQPVAAYVQERVWHPSQACETGPDGRVVLTMEVCNDRALRRWILSFGAGARVLEPAALARQVFDEIEAARAASRPEPAPAG